MNIVSNVKNYVCGLRQLVKFRSKKIFISKGTFLHPKVIIGKCTRINATSHIDQCTIGAFCAIGGRLVVRSSNHFHNFLNMNFTYFSLFFFIVELTISILKFSP